VIIGKDFLGIYILHKDMIQGTELEKKTGEFAAGYTEKYHKYDTVVINDCKKVTDSASFDAWCRIFERV